MRIAIMLNEDETARRNKADPDKAHITDRHAIALGERLWPAMMSGPIAECASGIDLVDSTGTYLYTIIGSER